MTRPWLLSAAHEPTDARPPRPGRALDAARVAGVPAGVVANQSGGTRGPLTRRQVEGVRPRVEELLGPFAVRAVCPHGPGEGSGCRKTAPGRVPAACRGLALPPERTVFTVDIGDIGADAAAARAAGARGVLVPTAVTRPKKIAEADAAASDLSQAVPLALDPAVPAGEAR